MYSDTSLVSSSSSSSSSSSKNDAGSSSSSSSSSSSRNNNKLLHRGNNTSTTKTRVVGTTVEAKTTTTKHRDRYRSYGRIKIILVPLLLVVIMIELLYNNNNKNNNDNDNDTSSLSSLSLSSSSSSSSSSSKTKMRLTTTEITNTDTILSTTTGIKKVKKMKNMGEEFQFQNNIKVRKQKQKSKSSSSLSSLSSGPYCKQVYLWNSHKYGSTTLYYVLTRGPDGLDYRTTHTNSPFYKDDSIGKEPCFGSSGWKKWIDLSYNKKISINNNNNDNSNKQKSIQYTHILNGCPSRTSIRDTENVIKFHNNVFHNDGNDNNDNDNDNDNNDGPIFLYSIRDPVDRLVSHLNNDKRRGGKTNLNVQEFAHNLALQATSSSSSSQHIRKSLQGKSLQNLLSVVKNPSKQILVIPMISLEINLQSSVDKIMDFIGGQRWKLNYISSNTSTNTDTDNSNTNTNTNTTATTVREHKGTGRNDWYKYETITNETRNLLRTIFIDDVLLLERLLFGDISDTSRKKLPWSSWAHNTHNTKEENDDGDGDGGDTNWLVTTPYIENI